MHLPRHLLPSAASRLLRTRSTAWSTPSTSLPVGLWLRYLLATWSTARSTASTSSHPRRYTSLEEYMIGYFFLIYLAVFFYFCSFRFSLVSCVLLCFPPSVSPLYCLSLVSRVLPYFPPLFFACVIVPYFSLVSLLCALCVFHRPVCLSST